ESYLLSYNFAKLEQVAAKLTTDEKDVMYTVVHLGDETVAAYSENRQFLALSADGALQGKKLHDRVSLRALKATEPLVQRITIPQTKTTGYDVAIPVSIPESGQKWATVRVGLSLNGMDQEIARTRWQLLVLGLLGVAFSMAVAAFLAKRVLR